MRVLLVSALLLVTALGCVPRGGQCGFNKNGETIATCEAGLFCSSYGICTAYDKNETETCLPANGIGCKDGLKCSMKDTKSHATITGFCVVDKDAPKPQVSDNPGAEVVKQLTATAKAREAAPPTDSQPGTANPTISVETWEGAVTFTCQQFVTLHESVLTTTQGKYRVKTAQLELLFDSIARCK